MHKSVDRRSILKKNNIQANLEARRCIKSALLALLKKKSYDDIRMTDIINKSGVTIRVHASDIRQTGRVAQGVKLIDIAKRNDVISNVCVVAREEEEEETSENSENSESYENSENLEQ